MKALSSGFTFFWNYDHGYRFRKRRFCTIDWLQSNPGSRVRQIHLEWKGIHGLMVNQTQIASGPRQIGRRNKPDGVQWYLMDLLLRYTYVWFCFYGHKGKVHLGICGSKILLPVHVYLYPSYSSYLRSIQQSDSILKTIGEVHRYNLTVHAVDFKCSRYDRTKW